MSSFVLNLDTSPAFFDPLKDSMILNRVMRRSIEGRTNGLNGIHEDKDYRTIEVWTIYQYK